MNANTRTPEGFNLVEGFLRTLKFSCAPISIEKVTKLLIASCLKVIQQTLTNKIGFLLSSKQIKNFFDFF
jgi:hypothetical protein